MGGWGAGWAIGVGVGFILGLFAAKEQKPWKKRSKKEKVIHILSIAGITLMIATGLVLYFWLGY